MILRLIKYYRLTIWRNEITWARYTQHTLHGTKAARWQQTVHTAAYGTECVHVVAHSACVQSEETNKRCRTYDTDDWRETLSYPVIGWSVRIENSIITKTCIIKCIIKCNYIRNIYYKTWNMYYKTWNMKHVLLNVIVEYSFLL